jgi:L-fuculose-phosphate aldolase
VDRAVTEADLRQQICLIGQLMHQNQYIDGAAGNISARLAPDRILTTPSGLAKGFMTPDQLIVVNMLGERIDFPTPANEHLRPTSELVMHLECYRQRDDVAGVVHAHPPTAVALTIAGYDFSQILIPEMVISLGIIATISYASASSLENRNLIATTVLQHDAILLAYHGSLTVAKHVWDAYLRLESLEHTAKILYMVQGLGGDKGGLTPDQIENLLVIREKLGLIRPGDQERFRSAAKS